MTDLPEQEITTQDYAAFDISGEEWRRYAAFADTSAPRKRVSELDIPGRTGKAFSVDGGQIVRITCHQDSQVGDFDLFNRENQQEYFSSSKSRATHGCHLTTGHRLWSHPIYQRPMMTIIADTVARPERPFRALSHDLLYGMCDEELYFRRTGRRGMPNCQDNLTKAVAEFGIGPELVHDPLNLFMVTGINDQGRLFYLAPEAKKGDYVELYAEMNLIGALSACPGQSSGPNPGGLKIEVFES